VFQNVESKRLDPPAWQCPGTLGTACAVASHKTWFCGASPLTALSYIMLYFCQWLNDQLKGCHFKDVAEAQVALNNCVNADRSI